MRYYVLRDCGSGCYVDYNGTKAGEAQRRVNLWKRSNTGWGPHTYLIRARTLSEAVEKLESIVAAKATRARARSGRTRGQ